ncbi:MAG: hypothetical protein ACRENE_09970 [Polyangiaceae bacterium]
MDIAKLFQVLVVTGASTTVGLAACSSTSSGGGSGGSSEEGGACAAACHPNATTASWTDCNGCCCWLPVGATCAAGPICGNEPCCAGRGR